MPRNYGTTNMVPYSAAPIVGSAGDTYFNTATGRAAVSDGTVWDNFALDTEVEVSGWISASYTWRPARNNEFVVDDLATGWGGFPKGTRINVNNPGVIYGVVIDSSPGAAGILANPLTPVSWNLVANGTFTRASNGLVNGDLVSVTAGSGTMPGGIAANAPYYVVNINAGAGTFQLSSTPGGTSAVLTGTPATCQVQMGTHVTLAPNADYGINRGAALTGGRYSYTMSPPGYPGWYNYTTAQAINPLTFTLGYSAAPTSLVYNYRIDGNMCVYNLRDGANGTSNTTTLSISLPVQASSTPAGAIWNGSSAIVDNGATVSTAAGLQIGAGATVVQCWRDYGNVGGWTASLGKRIIRGQIIYGI